jgi:DedD protein
MDDGIKRKLVGAGALVVVAFILLPLVSPRTQDVSYLNKSVPYETNLPDMSMPLPKSLSLATRDLSAQQLDTRVIPMANMNVDGNTLKPKNITVPVVDASGQIKVWHIQVASFAKPNNAILLRNELRKAGYKAFDKPSTDGEYIRVFVGPSTQKGRLEQKLSVIEKTFKIKGELVPYLGN